MFKLMERKIFTILRSKCLFFLTYDSFQLDKASEILQNHRYSFFAQKIRIFEFLAWVRNSFLTHVILSRLLHAACTLVVLKITDMVV